MTDIVERVARQIANANGDEFANAFKNKARWIAKRGESGGRFREASEPFQSDYLDMARAAIAAMRYEDGTDEHIAIKVGNAHQMDAVRLIGAHDAWIDAALGMEEPQP